MTKTECHNETLYKLRKSVLYQNPESTKLRIVYDASARATPTSSSLNGSLKVQLAIQNLLCGIISRSRFRLVALYEDVQKAFSPNCHNDVQLV